MSSNAPEPVTTDDGETVAYKCPDCGVRRLNEEKAAKCCSASDAEDKTPRVETGKTTVQDGYYQQNGIKDLSHALGHLDIDGLPTAQCLGVHDYYGWYQDRPENDPDTIRDGFDGRGSVYAFADDYNELSRNIDRALYVTTNYQHLAGRDWLLFSRDEDNSKEWKNGESPMPGYDGILGFSILADIDLEAEHKERPLPAGTRETVERAIGEYVGAFADLVGDRESVFALDSVGGAYLLTPPAATAPIAKAFDGDGRKRVFEALRKRADEWLDNEREKINATVAGTEGVFDADLLNQVNRQYKAPLSIHKSIDGVVHPLDIEDGEPSYEFVPLADADTVVDETVVWATEFTHAKHAEAVDEIISSLWPEYAGEYDGWQDALEAWLSDEREAEREQQRKEQQAAAERERRSEERDDDLPAFTAAIADDADIGITPDFDDMQAAVDDIDARKVVQKLCDEYDTDPGRTPTRFEPGYRDSESGTSCYVDSDKIVDLPDTHTGIGVLDYVARENRYVGETDTATDDDRAKARDDLRELGFEIPLWTPAKGTETFDGDEFEEMPFWAMRKAAVVLDVFPEDGFVEKESDDGSTYPGFPGAESYNNTLDAIEAAGLDHGRERADTSPDNPEYPLFDEDRDGKDGYTVTLWPKNGAEAILYVNHHDAEIYSETVERGAWESGHKRGRIAGRVGDELDGHGDLKADGVKSAMKSVLVDINTDSGTDEFEEAMRSERERGLQQRTLSVVCFPAEDGSEWVVTLQAPNDAPVNESREITFDAGDLQNQNPGPFMNAHLSKFLTDVALDSEEWQNLTRHWLDIQTVRQWEVDGRKETAIERFVSKLKKMEVWGDEAGFDWDSQNGFFADGYHDGEDAVLIPGRWAITWQQDNDLNDLNFTRLLRENGIMLCEPRRETIAGEQYRMWVISAEATGHSYGKTVESDDESDAAPPGVGR